MYKMAAAVSNELAEVNKFQVPYKKGLDHGMRLGNADIGDGYKVWMYILYGWSKKSLKPHITSFRGAQLFFREKMSWKLR